MGCFLLVDDNDRAQLEADIARSMREWAEFAEECGKSATWVGQMLHSAGGSPEAPYRAGFLDQYLQVAYGQEHGGIESIRAEIPVTKEDGSEGRVDRLVTFQDGTSLAVEAFGGRSDPTCKVEQLRGYLEGENLRDTYHEGKVEGVVVSVFPAPDGTRSGAEDAAREAGIDFRFLADLAG
jgi:hypothetical protein